MTEYFLPYIDETNINKIDNELYHIYGPLYDGKTPLFVRYNVRDYPKLHNSKMRLWRAIVRFLNGKWYAISGDEEGPFDTKEEAMESLDKQILSRGWYLIPDNQTERFTKKLVLLL